MRKFILGLWMLAVLTACSGTDLSVYEPEASDVPLETWQEAYPVEYSDWEDSAHGQAYLNGDSNAPGCTDCHDDPESGEIRTAAFNLEIPARCARCHSDESTMSEYDISADVYDTYLADYHGTTIAYYQAADTDAYRYEAVCSDCHGSHAIYAPEDERSSVAGANLTTTCQKCHHDAPADFASAFGHYRPAHTPVSSAESPILFWVKLFYQALIPVTLGGMILYIILDIRFRLQKRKEQHV